MDIKERIEILLHFKNLSPSQFAEQIGVQRSSISHILSGRNKPSLDFIKKIVEHYPEISYDWLIDGSGSLNKKESDSKVDDENPVDYKGKQAEKNDLSSTVNKGSATESLDSDTNVNSSDVDKSNFPSFDSDNKPIEQITVFYKDGSFKTYFPRTKKGSTS